MHYYFRFYTALCCFTALLTGCSGGEGTRTYEVTGTVQWDGQPVAGSSVFFVPMEDDGKTISSSVPMAFGATDEQGIYRLTVPGNSIGSGAAVGSYKVTVKKGPSVDGPINDPSKVSLIPYVYAEAATTPLKADVTTDKSKNVFNFTLEGKAP